MTTVTFETAGLADAIRKAERACPTKGESFDKAAGLVFDLYPSEGQAILRATNLQVFYREWLTPLSISGSTVMWRLPSKVLASFIGKLPIRTNSTVTFRQEGSVVHVECGRTKAKFLMITQEYYPEWDSFETTDGMEMIPNFGGRVTQVEWAADPRNHELGVRFTQDAVMATDGTRFAYAEIKFPACPEEGIIIPSRILAGILRPEQSVRVGINGQYLVMMPDEMTQIFAIRMGTKYPPVDRVIKRDWEHFIEVRKTDLIEMIQRSMSIIDAERMPNMLMWIGQEELAIQISEDERGHVGDVMEIIGQAIHQRAKYAFTPDKLLDALNAAPNETLRIGYYVPVKMKPLYIDGGSGYEAWVAPRRPNAPAEIKENND